MTRSASDPPALSVGIISLGCAKNLVDAEIMLGALLREGMEITNEPARADAVIVNTCSFIDTAQEESVDTILESDALRTATNRGQALVVSGCLSQRFRDRLPGLFPEVDAFMGIDEVAEAGRIVREALERRRQKMGEGNRNQNTNRNQNRGGESGADRSGSVLTRTVVVPPRPPVPREFRGPAKERVNAFPDAQVLEVHRRPTYIPDYETPRFRLTPRHFAYVKIAEGCNHPCSFCTIPRMRGSHRSRRQEDVVREVRRLLKEGVKEINLISQDSTYYGLDLRPNASRAIASPERFGPVTRALPAGATTLCSLLRELNGLRGEFWIRILYTHPAHWTDELIQTIADCRKVARYVDIPLQHIHDNLLERMRRETSRAYIGDLLRRIRAGVPGIVLRTTFIVGFPGETRAGFASLLDFIRETRFERLGVFTYSREEGTRAAAMAGHMTEREKQWRREQAMAVQHEVARQVAGERMGRILKVLVEGEATASQLRRARVSSWEHGLIRSRDEGAVRLKGRYHVARSEADAPDIDGRVYVRGAVQVGRFTRVRVVGHTDYDLIAEPA